jgi:copper(I)-binding protein
MSSSHTPLRRLAQRAAVGTLALGLLAGAPALLAPQANAHHPGDEPAAAKEIKVSHAWTVAETANPDSFSVYLTLWNEGETTDRLESAHVDFADNATIQPGAKAAGDLSGITSIALKPGQAVTLHPHTVRLVFANADGLPNPGDHFQMHLDFAKAGEIAVEVEVLAPRDADQLM